MRLPQSSRALFSFTSKTLIFVLGALASMSAHTYSQQLQSSPNRLAFGSVGINQSLTQTVTLTNTGSTSISISAVTDNSTSFSTSGLTLPATLAAGQSASLNITFLPTTSGSYAAAVTVTSTASNTSLQIGVGGYGVSTDPLTGSPSSLSFGQVNVGSSSILPVVVTSPSSRVVLTAYQVAGSGYTVSGPTLPVTIRRGQSITLNVTFKPSVSGTSNGSIFLPGPGLTIPLTGSGASSTAGQLTLSPSSLAFGNVDVGSTSTLSSTITASGNSVTVSSSSSSNSQFAISGVTLPLTLAPGQSAQFNVTYTPSASGALSATVTLGSNASNSTSTESLSGTGVTPTYSVNLSWNASTSSVSGYNVYRGTVSGVYNKINSSLDPTTSYTDGTAAGGMTYYYAATAVNSSGQESTYSSPITVVIP